MSESTLMMALHPESTSAQTASATQTSNAAQATKARPATDSSQHTGPTNSDDVLHVAFTDHSFVVYLADGCVLSVPLEWYPLLKQASPAGRSNWMVTDDGRGIRWPKLGQYFSVSGLLDGDSGPSSAA